MDFKDFVAGAGIGAATGYFDNQSRVHERDRMQKENDRLNGLLDKRSKALAAAQYKVQQLKDSNAGERAREKNSWDVEAAEVKNTAAYELEEMKVKGQDSKKRSERKSSARKEISKMYLEAKANAVGTDFPPLLKWAKDNLPERYRLGGYETNETPSESLLSQTLNRVNPGGSKVKQNAESIKQDSLAGDTFPRDTSGDIPLSDIVSKKTIQNETEIVPRGQVVELPMQVREDPDGNAVELPSPSDQPPWTDDPATVIQYPDVGSDGNVAEFPSLISEAKAEDIPSPEKVGEEVDAVKPKVAATLEKIKAKQGKIIQSKANEMVLDALNSAGDSYSEWKEDLATNMTKAFLSQSDTSVNIFQWLASFMKKYKEMMVAGVKKDIASNKVYMDKQSTK